MAALAPPALRTPADYARGAGLPQRAIQDKKLRTLLRRSEAQMASAAQAAAQADSLYLGAAPIGFLAADSELERTGNYTQESLRAHVDLATQQRMFNLKLDTYGPYALDYTRQGRHLVIGGKKGHVAAFDWQAGKLFCELHLDEAVRDVKWLHNELFFAVAQKKYTYIYDRAGIEVSCLAKHIDVHRLEFLPYHFLLASIGNAGWLRYQDTTTGQFVSEHRTRLGKCSVMTHNPQNAVVHCGHANGTVTLWSPNSADALVKMLTHRGAVTAAAIDRSGHYLTTTGLDSQLKVWDLRTYKELHSYYTPTPAASLAVSQTGLLAVGWGPHVTVWKDAFAAKQKAPYMSHLQPASRVSGLAFVPFQDTLGVAHAQGVASLAIPGAGSATYDASEVNPFETRRERQNKEVAAILEKIPSEMIVLDSCTVGGIDRPRGALQAAERRKEWEANNPREKYEPRKRARGKSSTMRRYLRKQGNVIDGRREELKQRLAKQQQERERAKKDHDEQVKAAAISQSIPDAVLRFKKK